MHFEIISIGILMGIAFAAPPGAVTAETFRRGARGGFPVALSVQLGSLIGDATYAALALAGLAVLAQNAVMQITLGVLGALYLMYLAWASLRSNLEGVEDLSSLEKNRNAFVSGMAISLTNPWAIAFWLSLGGALATFGIVDASMLQVVVFFLAFMLGSAIWAMVIAFGISFARRWLSPRVFRALTIVCGVALGAFSLMAMRQVVFAILGWQL